MRNFPINTMQVIFFIFSYPTFFNPPLNQSEWHSHKIGFQTFGVKFCFFENPCLSGDPPIVMKQFVQLPPRKNK
jgi:hypothetical protein